MYVRRQWRLRAVWVTPILSIVLISSNTVLSQGTSPCNPCDNVQPYSVIDPCQNPLSTTPGMMEVQVEPLEAPAESAIDESSESASEDVMQELAEPIVPTEPLTQPNVDLSSGLATNFGAGGASGLAFSDMPNMMGDFLGSGRNTNFVYNLAGDANPAKSSGGSTVQNSKLSDNNSAIPRDRLSFRYHYFHNAATQKSVQPTGNKLFLWNTPTPAPLPGGPVFEQDVVQQFDDRFDAHLFEFAMERRLTEDFSIEMRIPFTATLDSNLELDSLQVDQPFKDAGNFEDDLFGSAFPQGTLGNYDFEIRDLTLISKAVLLRDCNYVLSGGLGVRVPISNDSTLRVYDGINTNPNVFASIRQPDGSFVDTPLITMFRERDIRTDLQTVSLTPFLAVAAQLTKKSFFNGFASIEAPLGKDKVTYRERYLDASPTPGFIQDPTVQSPAPAGFPDAGNPFSANNTYNVFARDPQTQRIREQTLLSIDMSIGRWIYEARSRCQRLQRLALISELHYTTTLNDADIAQFQSVDANGNAVIEYNQAFTTSSLEDPFTVGNLSNRLDVLNANFGIYSQWGQNLTVATGVGVPLRDDDDKLFDWELQLQLNYYPRGFSGLPTVF